VIERAVSHPIVEFACDPDGAIRTLDERGLKFRHVNMAKRFTRLCAFVHLELTFLELEAVEALPRAGEKTLQLSLSTWLRVSSIAGMVILRLLAVD
jgi:hypothetical protein